jgi:hypothetical protein
VTHAGLFGFLEHGSGVGEAVSHRLLADHMLASFERRHRNHVMQVVRRRDDHRIRYTGDHEVVVVRKGARAASPVRELGRTFGVAATDCGNPGGRVALQARQVHCLSPPAGSDNSDPHDV